MYRIFTEQMFGRPRYAHIQLRRVVNFVLILFLTTALQVGARSYAQKVNINVREASLEDVLFTIRQQSGYDFLYNTQLMKSALPVSLSLNNAPVTKVLEAIFEKQPLTYIINKKTVTLTHKQAPERTVFTVHGTVTDSKGVFLQGVSIQLKGTTTGTISLADGTYRLNLPDASGTLVFGFIGFARQEIPVNGKNLIDVTLLEDDTKLSEIVVTGYTTQSRHSLTSAIASVPGEELNKRVATNPVTLLQGQLPGLQVVQASGEPGAEGVNLRIRGTSTFSGAGNDPLVIVDGLPGSLGVLNPNDIESVSILKDAASAAIYGSRGANGVILVKTKRGRSGGFSLQYNYNVGISNPTSLPDVISNSAEFMELSNEANINSGRQPIYTQAQIDLYRNATDRIKYPNHNWLDDLFETAIVHNHYLNLSGGKDNTSYTVGVGYTDQPGTMIGFDYKKYTLDLGLSSKVNKRVSIGANIQMRYGDKRNPPQGASDQFLSTLAQSPLYPPQAPDGKWIRRAYPNETGNKNSIAIVKNGVITRFDDYYLQGNISLDVQLVKGLIWENRAGLNYNAAKFNDFRPVVPLYYYNDMSAAGLLDVGTPGLQVGRNDIIYNVYYSQLSYKRPFGEHNVAILGGFQQEHNKASNLNAGRNQFTTNLLRELDAGPSDGMTNSGTSSEWAIRSFYGSLNYDYHDKYLFGSSIRYDGTSRLPNDTRWGLFYSFSAGWRISSEAFLQQVSWLNDLKIRGSWGELGNQNIGNYPYQSTLDSRNYAFGGTVQPGYSASTLVDPDLTWETTRMLDIGLDVAVLKNKLSLTFDWFNKYTFDILRSSQVPLWLGLNAPTINDGAVRNRGFELAVQYRDNVNKDFGYFVGVNIQRYNNTLEKYGKTEKGSTTIREEGRELDGYYLYIWDGVFQSQDEIDKSPKHPVTPTPGDLKIKDVDGNGEINPDDRTYVSGRYPAYQYAVNLGANWKKFDFSAQVYGSEGQKVYVDG